MPNVARIHQNKRPIRRHFIKEWMETREMTPAELIEQLSADRSTVYRWLGGQMPQPAQQEQIAALFQVEPEALLRHPDDDWIAKFFEGRQAEERERIKKAMELAWPKRSANSGQ